MKNLTGIVLCGGKSTRMGRDKGLISLDQKPWAWHMASKLRSLGIQTYLSINKTQQEAYSSFNKNELITDQTVVPGPVNGLLSAHRQLPGQDLLLVACDMIKLTEETLLLLISAYQHFGKYDFFAFHNSEVWEPFCAIYTSRGLERFKNELKETSDHSFQHLLKEGHTYRLEIENPQSFTNHNS